MSLSLSLSLSLTHIFLVLASLLVVCFSLEAHFYISFLVVASLLFCDAWCHLHLNIGQMFYIQFFAKLIVYCSLTQASSGKAGRFHLSHAGVRESLSKD